ncbi:MAG: hypothetical protein ABEH43_05705 [Flavobacteriales bacterium]
MKRNAFIPFILIVFILLGQVNGLLAQEQKKAKKYYQEAFDSISSKNYKAAIQLLDSVLKWGKDFHKKYGVYFNRAVAKNRLEKYDSALEDFEKAVELKPDYKKAYVQMAIIQMEKGKQRRARKNLDKAIELDTSYTHALLNRGMLYIKGKNDKEKGCKDLEKALAFGDKSAVRYIKKHCENSKELKKYKMISITEVSNDSSYGRDGENPIKVGTGAGNGPNTEQAYLNLLRSPTGEKIKYKRIGSCCPYPSKNAPSGKGKCDMFRVEYKDKEGKLQKKILYLTFYEYRSPKIPLGFKYSQ